MDRYQTYESHTAGDVAQEAIHERFGDGSSRIVVRPPPCGERTPTFDLGDHVATALRAAEAAGVVVAAGRIYESDCIARALYELGSDAPAAAGDADDPARRDFVERFRRVVGRDDPHHGDALAFTPHHPRPMHMARVQDGRVVPADRTP